MPVLPSIQYGDLKGNHTISGTAEPNARVLLFNPVEGRYVKSVDADASGNFDFGVLDSTVPLQIRIAGSNDFTCVSSSLDVKPAISINSTKGKIVRGIQSVFSLNASNYIWSSAPKIIFSDAAGSGSGASAFFTMAGQGELALTGFSGTPVAFDLGTGPDGTAWYGPGYTIKSYTMTSFGNNYSSPKCFVVGNRLTWEQDLSQPGIVYHIVSNAVSVELTCITTGTAEVLVNEANLLSEVGITWGATNTWGTYSNSNSTGNRLLVQIPGYSNIEYNVSCTTEDSTQPGPVLQEKIVEIMAATISPRSEAVWNSADFGLYLAIIHGYEYDTHDGEYVATGQPRAYDNSTPNQNLPNSAFTAQSNGTISSRELDYLKGWLAQAVQVNAMVNTAQSEFLVWRSISLNILQATGHENSSLKFLAGLVGETVHQLDDVIRRWNQANATSSNYIQNLCQVFWQEFQQSLYRTPALLDAATGNTKKIKDILARMGNANGSNYLNGIKTHDNTGTYRWDFTGNTLQKIQIN